MTKFWVASFSALVLPLSLFAAGNQSFYLNLLLETDAAFTVARVVIIFALLGYAFMPKLRTVISKEILGIVGILLIAAAGVSLFSPTLLGYLGDYSAIGDSFIFLESGILARVMSLELPVTQRQAPVLQPSLFATTFKSSNTLSLLKSSVRIPQKIAGRTT